MSTYPSPPPPYQPPGNMAGAFGTPPPPGNTPPGGKRQYGALAALVLAPIFHTGLYRDVARNWRGIAALYLLLLTAISALATSIHAHIEFRRFARDEVPGVIQDVPPISIRDGVVSSPVDQPYEIKNRKTGEVFAIIDTTGSITRLQDTNAQLLLTRSELQHRDNNQIKVQDLSQVKSFDLDQQKLQRWVDTFGGWVGPGLFVLLWIGVFVWRLLQSLLYALFGMAFGAMFHARLTYQQLIRLSVISMTAPKLLSTAMEIGGVNIPFWSFISFALTMVYLGVAVKANAEEPIAPGGFPMYQPPQAPITPMEGRPMM